MITVKDKRIRRMTRAQAEAVARLAVSKLDPEAAKRIYMRTAWGRGLEIQEFWELGKKKEIARIPFAFTRHLVIQLPDGKIKGIEGRGVYGGGFIWAEALRKFLECLAFFKYEEAHGGWAKAREARKNSHETLDDIYQRGLTELGLFSQYEKAKREDEEFDARLEARRKKKA